MGYIAHHAILVTDTNYRGYVEKAHKVALSIFNKKSHVSDLIESDLNGYVSFFIAPDGSKEGWNESNDGDTRRDKFIEELKKLSVDYCEVRFGGDNPEWAQIERHSGNK